MAVAPSASITTSAELTSCVDRVADRLDDAIFTKNCIAGLKRRFPIAADDLADVYDGSLHPSLLDVSAMPQAR